MEYFCDAKKFTPLLALTTGFGFSMLLAPLSCGIIFFIIFIVTYEIVLAFYSNWICDYKLRIGVLFASILGFIIGSILVSKNPFDQIQNFSWEKEKNTWLKWFK